MKYSVIIPVFNRPDEVEELLESLAKQSYKNFELILVEDGSTLPCKSIADSFSDALDIKYFFKENSGPGESRNYGMAKATGDMLVFFDSDCIIPPKYFEKVELFVHDKKVDCYGGPDAAHSSFSNVQKAINFAMTSILTTGGIRGKKNKLDNYQARSFNMGISKEVYQRIGGYSDLHPGEDPDLSYRIMNAGYHVHLIEEAYVFHKRRIDFRKFAKQVYKFGVVRNILMKWYPEKAKIVYFFPATFLIGSLVLLVGAYYFNLLLLLPLGLIATTLFIEALVKTKNLWIALLAVPASFIQLYCYGYGFLKGFFKLYLLGQDERKALPNFFFIRK